MERGKSNFDVLKKIEDERLARGWTEYMLAKKSGVTQSTISSWYRMNMQPSIVTLERVCDAFGMTLSEFFLDDDKSKISEAEINTLYEQLTPVRKKAVTELLKSICD